VRLTRTGRTGGASSGIVVASGEAPRIERCVVRGNVSKNRDSGGGILCEAFSAPVIRGCRIEGNAAPIAGGGIYSDGAFPVLEDCSIAGNWSGRFGGGLCLRGGSAAIRNCEIWGNAAIDGGGLESRGTFLEILHSTLAGNSPRALSCWTTGEARFHGSIFSGGMELNPEAVLSSTGSLIDDDPLFLDPGSFDFGTFRLGGAGGASHPLPDFIVRRPDLRPAPGSPAIDLAPCEGAPPLDIDGTPRPQGKGCEAGARESATAAGHLFVRGRANDDGRVDVSDSVFVLTYLFLGGPAPACLDGADMNDDGRLDIGVGIGCLSALFLGGSPIPAPSGD